MLSYNTKELSAGNRKHRSIVLMDKITSTEHYLAIGREPIQVLKSVSIDIRLGEIWAFSGKDTYAVQLLLEIMGNIKPYESGRCILDERGMTRHKRAVLPHVFYIGSTEMIYNSMNVLEFLMFVTANSNFNVKSQQERILDHLAAIGMSNISLSPVSTLTPENKALVLLTAAVYSLSRLIVLNIPFLEFDESQIFVLKKLFDILKCTDRTLVMSTHSPFVIENAFSHIAYLKDGRIFYKGSTDEFITPYDKSVLTIEDNNAEELKEKLSFILPLYDYEIKKDTLTLYNRTSSGCSPSQLYRKITEAGCAPEKIKITSKTVENAISEIERGL